MHMHTLQLSPSKTTNAPVTAPLSNTHREEEEEEERGGGVVARPQDDGDEGARRETSSFFATSSSKQQTSKKRKMATNEQPTRAKLQQTFLDFGQRDFDRKTCKVCGMVYAPGVPADEKLHKQVHAKAVAPKIVRVWADARVVAQTPSMRIVSVLSDDPQATWRRVASAVDAAAEALGETWDAASRRAARLDVLVAVQAQDRVAGVSAIANVPSRSVRVVWVAPYIAEESERTRVRDALEASATSHM